MTPALNLLRTLLAFGALVVPTFFMGATLPALTQLMVSSHDELSDRMAWLYGLNTMGAVGGTLLSAFVSIPALGVSRTQFLAVAVNVGVAMLAFAIDRVLPVRSGLETEETAAPSPGSPGATAPLAPAWIWPTRLAFWGTAVSGMCALALEVLWTRGIATAVGSTIYSFAVMLAAFLVGIWLGSWLHAVFPLRRVPESVQLGVALVLVGLLSFGASHAIPALPEFMVRLNVFLYDDLNRVRGGTTLLLSFAVMLVPTLFMGDGLLPLASEARARLRVGFGRSVGDTLGLNTLGSITGSLAAGFVLIPLLGLQRSMALAAAVSLAYGVVVLGAAAAAWQPGHRAWLAVATLVAVCSAFALPVTARPWDLSVLGAFQSHRLRSYVGDGDRVDVGRQLVGLRLLYYREGRGSTVSVLERRGNRTLVVSGKPVATDILPDMQHELLLGHLPILLHPAPRSALVVGLGAGITLGAVATHEEIETLKLVEIERAVVEAAALFSHANGNVLEDPRLEIAIQDGRNFLKTSPDSFDVITADPIHPWAAGASYLYTAEYFQMARTHLREGGVMCQWLPTYGLSHEDFRSVVASFAAAFPHMNLWQTSHDVLLIGSHAPLQVDLGLLTRRLAQPGRRAPALPRRPRDAPRLPLRIRPRLRSRARLRGGSADQLRRQPLPGVLEPTAHGLGRHADQHPQHRSRAPDRGGPGGGLVASLRIAREDAGGARPLPQREVGDPGGRVRAESRFCERARLRARASERTFARRAGRTPGVRPGSRPAFDPPDPARPDRPQPRRAAGRSRARQRSPDPGSRQCRRPLRAGNLAHATRAIRRGGPPFRARREPTARPLAQPLRTGDGARPGWDSSPKRSPSLQRALELNPDDARMQEKMARLQSLRAQR